MNRHGLSRVTEWEDDIDVQTFEMNLHSFPSTVWADPGSGYSISVDMPLPDIVVIPGGTPNDNYSAGQANGDLGWYQVLDLVEYCYANKITPIVTTCTPANSSVAHPNTYDDVVAVLKSRVLQSRVLYFDFNSAVGNSDGGYKVGYGYQEDPNNEVHPNETGQAAMASVATVGLSNIIRLNNT